MRLRRDDGFFTLFDERSGAYLRSNRYEDGRDTGEDPFSASFPELLDVGIMGHCVHGRRGLCLTAGVECYQRGPETWAPNMSLANFCRIADECAGRTFQFALGGRGDPDQHEDFAAILDACREREIVCNFTTSGLGMTPEVATRVARSCGAVAVSWYRAPHTLAALDMLLAAGAKTNVHFVLTAQTLKEAIRRLDADDFPSSINAVVFLLHKPVGLGSKERMVRLGHPLLAPFLELAVGREHPFKVGFDSCSVPALVSARTDVDASCLDTCEGARFSAYVTPDLHLLPCSFDADRRRWDVDLHTCSIEEAWAGEVFEDFRNRLRSACPTCAQRALCMGGCPIAPEIVLCEERQKAMRLPA